jgi:hypothetical protein
MRGPCCQPTAANVPRRVDEAPLLSVLEAAAAIAQAAERLFEKERSPAKLLTSVWPSGEGSSHLAHSPTRASLEPRLLAEHQRLRDAFENTLARELQRCVSILVGAASQPASRLVIAGAGQGRARRLIVGQAVTG